MRRGVKVTAFVLLGLAQINIGHCELDYVQVEIDKGTLRGIHTATWHGVPYSSFKGIPYAKPPVGNLRFKGPQEVEAWNGVKDAVEHGSTCPQANIATGDVEGTEDCLFLNVYTPSTKARGLPVMVFIHGGLFVLGSGNDGEYAPDYFIKNDVILVTFNYRLGALGFLSTGNDDAPGNAGMKDQVAALRWVKRNIAKFGGEPDNVTLFGESAGSAAVHHHLLSPMSAGLFQKAIGQSGSAANAWAVSENGVKTTIKLAEAVGAKDVDVSQALEFLKKASYKDIIGVQETSLDTVQAAGLLLDYPFVPTIETNVTSEEVFLADSPLHLLESGKFNKVPYITGYNTHEGYLALISLLKLNSNNISTSDLRRYIPTNIENVELKNELNEEMRRLYFGNQSAIESTADSNLINLLTDSLFAAGTQRATYLQLRSSNTPVYYYSFSYDGALNKVKIFFNINLPGAAHADELGYLFYAKLLPGLVPATGSEDEYVLNTMIRLWTNFAKYGNPTPDGDSLTWKPVTLDECNYLSISGWDTKPDLNLDSERANFWANAYERDVALRN